MFAVAVEYTVKSTCHVQLSESLKLSAKVRALQCGKTLTRYLSDLIINDLRSAKATAPVQHGNPEEWTETESVKEGVK